MAQRSTHIKTVTQHLRIVFRAVQAHSKYVEKQCGLSSAKLWMLYELNSKPGIKVSQLASALAIHPSTCSKLPNPRRANSVERLRNSPTRSFSFLNKALASWSWLYTVKMKVLHFFPSQTRKTANSIHSRSNQI